MTVKPTSEGISRATRRNCGVRLARRIRPGLYSAAPACLEISDAEPRTLEVVSAFLLAGLLALLLFQLCASVD